MYISSHFFLLTLSLSIHLSISHAKSFTFTFFSLSVPLSLELSLSLSLSLTFSLSPSLSLFPSGRMFLFFNFWNLVMSKMNSFFVHQRLRFWLLFSTKFQKRNKSSSWGGCQISGKRHIYIYIYIHTYINTYTYTHTYIYTHIDYLTSPRHIDRQIDR